MIEPHGKQVDCVILAAGWSRRMGAGTQKLLLPVLKNVPMICHVVKTALQSRISQIFVIVNPAFPEVSDALIDLPVVILENPAADRGMSTSFQLGVSALQENHADAGIFLLGDQPGIEQWIINRVLCSYEDCESEIIQACYDGTPGHPVLMNKSVFSFASEASGDEGGRRVISQFRDQRILVEMGISNPSDVDTVDDYQSFISFHGKAGAKP